MASIFRTFYVSIKVNSLPFAVQSSAWFKIKTPKREPLNLQGTQQFFISQPHCSLPEMDRMPIACISSATLSSESDMQNVTTIATSGRVQFSGVG